MKKHDIVVFVRDTPFASEGSIGLVTYTFNNNDVVYWVKISEGIEVISSMYVTERIGKL